MIQLRRMSLSELAEARTVVETATAELAAQRADEEALARIAKEVARGRQVVRERQPHAEASMSFHVAVAEAARNELLSATVSAYRDLVVQAVRDMRDPSSARVTQRAHEDILDALRARDAEAARRVMLAHLQDFEKRLRRWLRSKEERGTATKTGRRLVRLNGARRKVI